MATFRQYLKTELSKLLELENQYYPPDRRFLDMRTFQASDIVKEIRKRALMEGFADVAARCPANSISITLPAACEIVSGCIPLADKPEGPLTVKQAAEHLGLSTKTIYQLCADGKLPHKRIGRTIKIDLVELEKIAQKVGDRSGRSVADLEKCFQ